MAPYELPATVKMCAIVVEMSVEKAPGISRVLQEDQALMIRYQA